MTCMINRAAPFVTTLSVLAFMAWLGLSTRDVGRPDGYGGNPLADSTNAESRSRCGLPVGWRVADPDPRFGLSRAEVEAATRQAADLWEDAAGRRLFTADIPDGLPVRLVYDHRQVRTEERLRAEGIVREEDEILDRETIEISSAWEAHHDALASHLSERTALAEAIADHNQAARAWNDRGGAPDSVMAEMADREQRLRTLEGRLSSAARRLESDERALRVAEAELMTRVAARNERMGHLARTFPPTEVESGAFVDAEFVEASGVSHVRREIRVFRFEDREDLVRVLAHELGHALGLGHVASEGAVMSGRQGAGEPSRAPVSLHEADILALRDLCGGTPPR